MKLHILPSVLCRTVEEMKLRFEECQALVDEAHLDLADGLFVDNRLPGPDQIIGVPTTMKLEAHLMVKEPDLWVTELLQDSRVGTIIVHAESDGDFKKLFELIQRSECRAGLALNPKTGVEALQNWASLIDQVTVMTVEPGFNGSPFLPEMIVKIKDIQRRYPDLTIEADGGVSDQTLPQLLGAGVDRVTVGSYFSTNLPERLATLRRIAAEDKE